MRSSSSPVFRTMQPNPTPGSLEAGAGVASQRLRHIELLLRHSWSIDLEPCGFATRIQIANPVSFLAQKILIHKKREREDRANLTFALRRVLPARPNYIWFVCNTHHAKKARNSLSEDLPSFLSSRFLACCCFPCFCAAPRERDRKSVV